MRYVYILRCADNSLYCGQTTDLERRLREHNGDNKKSSKYLRTRRPVRLVYFEKHAGLSQALKREAEIKRMKKSDKERLVMYNV
ncbi:MAG: GIY-YIG nuclease family protein [Patescibacteria group bacterium]